MAYVTGDRLYKFDVLEKKYNTCYTENHLEKSSYVYTELQFIVMFSRVIENSESLIKTLIDEGSDINCTNKIIKAGYQNYRELSYSKYTPLMLAVKYSNETSSENTIRMLIDAGVGLNVKTRYGTTALMLASLCSNTTSTENTVKMLIDAGANLNIQDTDGKTALMFASSCSNTTSTENTVKMLLEAGADPNLQEPTHFNTALLYAIKQYSHNTTFDKSKNNTIKFLLDSGANINIQDKAGYTSLILAVIENDINIVKLLLKYKPDINKQERNGLTALMIASMNSNMYPNEEMIKLLIDNGSNMKIKNNSKKDCYDIYAKKTYHWGRPPIEHIEYTLWKGCKA